ncbi:hypothetical protein D9Q98_000597 [Chlorella vulgaris]|uniref:Uncharacterized protein n=1 Tax=Chlorella vulgaris TaxID=3077 RepID=A0A9D4Z1T1_CHLVU|nr:hypothetical protein D9Q98_000597 [Chlorella vulgaris]
MDMHDGPFQEPQQQKQQQHWEAQNSNSDNEPPSLEDLQREYDEQHGGSDNDEPPFLERQQGQQQLEQQQQPSCKQVVIGNQQCQVLQFGAVPDLQQLFGGLQAAPCTPQGQGQVSYFGPGLDLQQLFGGPQAAPCTPQGQGQVSYFGPGLDLQQLFGGPQAAPCTPQGQGQVSYFGPGPQQHVMPQHKQGTESGAAQSKQSQKRTKPQRQQQQKKKKKRDKAQAETQERTADRQRDLDKQHLRITDFITVSTVAAAEMVLRQLDGTLPNGILVDGVKMYPHQLDVTPADLQATVCAYRETGVLHHKNGQPYCHSRYLPIAAQHPLFGETAYWTMLTAVAAARRLTGGHVCHAELVVNHKGEGGMHQDGVGHKYKRLITRVSTDASSSGVGTLAFSGSESCKHGGVQLDLLGHTLACSKEVLGRGSPLYHCVEVPHDAVASILVEVAEHAPAKLCAAAKYLRQDPPATRPVLSAEALQRLPQGGLSALNMEGVPPIEFHDYATSGQLGGLTTAGLLGYKWSKKRGCWFSVHAANMMAADGWRWCDKRGCMICVRAYNMGKTKVWFDPQAGRVVADDGPGRVRIPAYQAGGRVAMARDGYTADGYSVRATAMGKIGGRVAMARDGYTADGYSVRATAMGKTKVWFDPQAGRVVADDGPGRVRIPAYQAGGRVAMARDGYTADGYSVRATAMGRVAMARDGYTADGYSVRATAMGKTKVWFDPQAGRVVADDGPGRVRIPAYQAGGRVAMARDGYTADGYSVRATAMGRVPLRRREEALLQLHQDVVIALHAQAEKATVAYTCGGNVRWKERVDGKSWTPTALGRLFNEVLLRLMGVDQERQAVIAVMRALQPGLWRESIVVRYNNGPVQ